MIKRAALLGLLPMLLVLFSCSGIPERETSSASMPFHPDGADAEPGRASVDSRSFGFFPSPPELTIESVFETYKVLGDHADILLYQDNVPWTDFVDGPDGDSQRIEELTNLRTLAIREGLEPVYVVDPLNGLNRREFRGLPDGWEAAFGNPRIQRAYKNYVLRLLREFRPRYLGLASEINTYADAHPDDFPNFLALYTEVYDAVKAESPETQVFVTFQWEDLNNLWPQPDEPDYVPGTIKWNQIEDFEPRLDLWVISSYPYIVFDSAAAIPEDYFTPLLTKTRKPLAVAEGGWISKDFKHLKADPDDQIGYLQAIDDQIGHRLAFWIYLLIRDIDIGSYAGIIESRDLETLEFFTTVGLIDGDGTPKPALAEWDRIRLAVGDADIGDSRKTGD